MKVRADVAELLRAGLSDAAISRQLHVDRRTAAEARATLGLPKCKPGPRAAATAEDLYWKRTQPTDDGHLLWTGTWGDNGVPTVRHSGTTHSAYRIAYRLANGREPEGHVRPSCGREGCVKPGHQTDRADRAQARKINQLYDAIFGASA